MGESPWMHGKYRWSEDNPNPPFRVFPWTRSYHEATFDDRKSAVAHARKMIEYEKSHGFRHTYFVRKSGRGYDVYKARRADEHEIRHARQFNKPRQKTIW